MFCQQCGTQNPDNARTCRMCGAAMAPPHVVGGRVASPATTVPNHLVEAILATICCCLPFGIVAIVYAAQVNGMLAGGNIAGAQRAAESAKMWCWIAFGLGLLSNALPAAVFLLGALAGH